MFDADIDVTQELTLPVETHQRPGSEEPDLRREVIVSEFGDDLEIINCAQLLGWENP